MATRLPGAPAYSSTTCHRARRIFPLFLHTCQRHDSPQPGCGLPTKWCGSTSRGFDRFCLLQRRRQSCTSVIHGRSGPRDRPAAAFTGDGLPRISPRALQDNGRWGWNWRNPTRSRPFHVHTLPLARSAAASVPTGWASWRHLFDLCHTSHTSPYHPHGTLFFMFFCPIFFSQRGFRACRTVLWHYFVLLWVRGRSGGLGRRGCHLTAKSAIHTHTHR